jgi:hypothetical protein
MVAHLHSLLNTPDEFYKEMMKNGIGRRRHTLRN